MKRGPKSMDDRLTVVQASDARLAPPTGRLTEQQEQLWREIVDSHPADFFRPADAPLLTAYCKAFSHYLNADRDIETRGATLMDDKGREYANPSGQFLVSQASAIAQLAVKLRLAPSSRTSPKVAGRAADQPSGNRPWERTG